MVVRAVPAVFASLLGVGCFAPDGATRGLPCTADSSCGGLTCSYGFCGGPPRCEAGAGVGDYCFSISGEPIEIGARVSAVAVGAVDMDAWPDVVVGAGDGGTLTVLANDGQGGVSVVMTSTAVGGLVTDLGIGAVDDGGLADVVATTASRVSLHPLVAQDGATQFAGAVEIAAGVAGPRLPQIGSFVDDADRRQDIAVLVDNGFDVIPQTGASAFGLPLHTPASDPTDLRSLGTAMERIYIAESRTSSVSGYDRRTDGTFNSRIEIEVGVAPERFVIGDVDRDGFSDLLVAGVDGTLWLTTGKNSAQDDWSNPREVYSLGWAPSMLVAVNLDDDAEPEYVIAGGPPSGPADVYLFDNDGDGKPIYGGSLGVSGAAVAVADLDRDGIAEFVAGSRESQLVVARRTVAPLPPGGNEGASATDSGTSGGPTDPTSASFPSEPTDPTLVSDSGGLDTDPITETMSADDGGTPSCEGGIDVGSVCFAIDYLLTPPADLVALAVGDYSADGDPDVMLSTADGTLTAVSAVGGANFVDWEFIGAGLVEPIISPFVDDLGFPLNWHSFTDGGGVDLTVPSFAESYYLTLSGARAPTRVDYLDGELYRPGILVIEDAGLSVIGRPASGVAHFSPTSAVSIAAPPYGGEIFVVATGGDVRLFYVDDAGISDEGVVEGMGAVTSVAFGNSGAIAGVEGSTLRYLGYDINYAPVISEVGDLGTIGGPIAVVDLNLDFFDDVVIRRGIDFGDGFRSQTLSVFLGNEFGGLDPEIPLFSSVTTFAVHQLGNGPAVYFATAGDGKQLPALWRLRSAF